MADMTLCTSLTCSVRKRCRRNEECPHAIKPGPTWQSYACWHPSAGAACPGFIDTTKAEEEA